MKKIYTLIAASTIVFAANAQNKSLIERIPAKNVHAATINPHVLPMAAGDTLMYMPLPETYVNPTDNADFNIVIEDIDGLSTNNTGADPDWATYYSTDSSLNGNGNPTKNNFFHSWETPGVDTPSFWSASSWFVPAGTANNWLMFGPITLPAGGTVMWFDRNNPGYRDGYKLFATTSPSSPVTFSDFTGAAFYTKTSSSNSPTKATDTTWVLRTVVVPPMYEAQSIYLAFQHDANDMDVLYLDEITVVESPLTIDENKFVNGAKLGQNSPNPFSNVSSINYELETSSLVALSVYDVTGKKVAGQNEGNKTSGKHIVKFDAENLPAGVYYYNLTVGKQTTSTMKMVVIK